MAAKKSSTIKGPEQNEAAIIATFQQMRRDQRKIISKISELDNDKNEHRLVIQTLKDVSPDRRCFRCVGGVLIERTVKDVLPSLEDHFEQLSIAIEKLKEQVEEKGRELSAYREKYNIRFRGEVETEKKSEDSKDSSESSQGILVT